MDERTAMNTWTRELPMKDGWYWFREDKTHDRYPVEKVVRVDVLKLAGPVFRDGRLPNQVSEWPGDWCGPIPEPGEAKPVQPVMYKCESCGNQTTERCAMLAKGSGIGLSVCQGCSDKLHVIGWRMP
jgi:hypothetical protein